MNSWVHLFLKAKQDMFYKTSVDSRSVYIHWPFCPYRCHFCPFVALAGQDQFMEKYHLALVQEIRTFAIKSGRKQPLNTLFFGGGTPSTYPDTLLLDMFGILKEVFVITNKTEVTIEVNPGTVRNEQFELWKSMGINRLSVGIQSLKDGVLQNLNRHQSITDVYSLLDKAPLHFENISIDLILGLPGVSPEEWKSFILEVVHWPIKHMSVYFLTVHEDTPLYFKVQKKTIELINDDTMVDLYYWTLNTLILYGFRQYELSNFSKPGFESQHNSVYWDRKPYKAFGLGACSFDGEIRSQNEKNLMKYIKNATNQEETVYFWEALTEKQIYMEKLMLNLRRSKGVSWSELEYNLSQEQQKIVREKVALFKQQNLIQESNSRLKLTVRGLVVENEIITQLLV